MTGNQETDVNYHVLIGKFITRDIFNTKANYKIINYLNNLWRSVIHSSAGIQLRHPTRSIPLGIHGLYYGIPLVNLKAHESTPNSCALVMTPNSNYTLQIALMIY